MVTIALILEVRVMGLLALGWMLVFSIRLDFLDPKLLLWPMRQSTQLQVLFAMVGLTLVYQLGSILNTLACGMLERLRGNNVKQKIFHGQYEAALGIVHQQAASHFLQDLDSQLRFIRLARSGFVNFIMLGLSVLSFGSRFAGVGILSLLVGVLCYH